jgi:hypothetical protein
VAEGPCPPAIGEVQSVGPKSVEIVLGEVCEEDPVDHRGGGFDR